MSPGVHVVNSADKSGVAAALSQAKDAAEDVRRRRSERAVARKKAAKGGRSIGGVLTNVVTAAMLGYGCFACHNIYKIFQPDFPDLDPGSGRTIRKFNNRIKPGSKLHARVWAGPLVPSQARRPAGKCDWEFDFAYDDGTFEPQTHTVPISVPPGLLKKTKNVHVYAEVSEASDSNRFFASAIGSFIKYTKPQELPPKYRLLSGELCEEHIEPTVGSRRKQLCHPPAPLISNSSFQNCNLPYRSLPKHAHGKLHILLLVLYLPFSAAAAAAAAADDDAVRAQEGSAAWAAAAADSTGV